MASVATVTKLSPCESNRSPLDKRREELERGVGSDHDRPYRFTLPTSMPQVLAWVKLLGRVQQGDLHREVVAVESGSSDAQSVSVRNAMGCSAHHNLVDMSASETYLWTPTSLALVNQEVQHGFLE